LGLGYFSFVVGKLEVDEEVGSHQPHFLLPVYCVESRMFGENALLAKRCIWTVFLLAVFWKFTSK